ncbi:MAG TPA: phosphoribosylglycinamide formyltransferase [Candidatus Binataceae bacterium]|nr:phosphoribosylglycinamide formyltransferase [Candidatus Binataceae bacterium]
MATQLPPVRLGVLISGTGSNLQAIIDAIAQGRLQAEIRLVISNRPLAPGLRRAQEAGLRTLVIDHRGFASRQEFDRRLREALEEAAVELVILAGFMRLLSPVMLEGFPDRIMNIHPALLPAFPGLNVQRAAIEHGARFSGCTVFFVREGIDDGPIIVQAVVPVYPDDSEADLARRIQLQEHRIYPQAIALYQQRRLHISGRRVLIKDWDTSNASAALINPEPD